MSAPAPPVLVPPADAVDPPLWWALRADHRLAGCSYPPAGFAFGRLPAERGIGVVVALTGEVGYDAAPVPVERFPLTDLAGVRRPPEPERELAAVAAAAGRVREVLADGQGVLVHCLGGTGRTGTVVGAVLVALGHQPGAVARWLDDVHRRRGARLGWPESPWQREALTALADAPPVHPDG